MPTKKYDDLEHNLEMFDFLGISSERIGIEVIYKNLEKFIISQYSRPTLVDALNSKATTYNDNLQYNEG